MDPILDLPLACISADALPRDRATLDPAALDDLVASIAQNGLRQPIEVWALSTPEPPFTHGLISGYRRLAAHRRLAELRQDASFTTIPAFLRAPTSVAAALAAMVEENECRADISPWEKARLITVAVSEGLFETPDAALAALHPLANPVQKSRLRSVVSVVEDFDEYLSEPQTWSLRQLMRLATAQRAGFTELLRATLQDCPHRTPDAQWSALQNTLDEAEDNLRHPQPITRPGRPRLLLHPRPGVIVRRERTRNGWSLHFTGEQAQGMMIDSVMDEIERMYGPG